MSDPEESDTGKEINEEGTGPVQRSAETGETRAINKPRQKEMKAPFAMCQNFGVLDFSSDF